MGATANLYGVRSIYGLCFVLAPWAYFTRLQLAQRWGDRGNRAMQSSRRRSLFR
jgi:hypothetical protein